MSRHTDAAITTVRTLLGAEASRYVASAKAKTRLKHICIIVHKDCSITGEAHLSDGHVIVEQVNGQGSDTETAPADAGAETGTDDAKRQAVAKELAQSDPAAIRTGTEETERQNQTAGQIHMSGMRPSHQ
jgi:hypothetical protein